MAKGNHNTQPTIPLLLLSSFLAFSQGQIFILTRYGNPVLSKMLQNYLTSQAEGVCPLTEVQVPDQTTFSTRLNTFLSKSVVPVTLDYFGSKTRGKLNSDGNRLVPHCKTKALFLSYENYMENLKWGKASSAPARDRFLIMSDEFVLKRVVLSNEFRQLRFVYSVALDTGKSWYKVPETSYTVLSGRVETDVCPGFSTKINNLSGAHLRIARIDVAPFFLPDPVTKVLRRGISHSSFSNTAKYYNYTYDWVIPGDPKNGTGQLLPNGVWTGMLGLVARGEADLAASASVTDERLDGPFEFTNIYYPTYGSFVTSHPAIAVRWETLVMPFYLEIWILLLVTLSITAATLYATLRVEVVCSREINMRAGHNLWLVAWSLPLKLLLEQGVRTVPFRIRPLFAAWMLFSMIMGIGYKEKLFGFMTFPKHEDIPRTIAELARRPDYTVLYNYWKSVQYVSWKTAANGSNFKDVYKRFERVKAGSCVTRALVDQNTVCIAYNYELDTSLALNLTYDEDFKPVFRSQEIFFSVFNYIPFRKGSLYYDSWKWIAANLRDCGMYSKWAQDIFRHLRTTGLAWLKKQEGSKVLEKVMRIRIMQRKVPQALKMDDILVLLVVYAFSSVVCIITFLSTELGRSKHGSTGAHLPTHSQHHLHDVAENVGIMNRSSTGGIALFNRLFHSAFETRSGASSLRGDRASTHTSSTT